MNLKPWREVAIPHEDVLRGTFQQSEFAADLTRVHERTATDEYRDPKLFYARTYITEGMRLLLDSIIRRLSGRGGEPVMQLQTAFGGGKTHTLLAVYHLAKGEVPLHELQGIGSIVDATGVVTVPKAHVVVLDGNQLSPNQPLVHEGQSVHTLWGELAWQLGGRTAYEKVRGADESGTSPGKGVLSVLLAEYAPCVLLMDELVAYLRQFEAGRVYTGGTFESNVSFIQALTESAKAVPSAMILAALPESELELGGPRAEQALDTLEKVFGRVQALWKPVGAEEAFEIVRRRLFSSISNEQGMEETCQAYADLYLQHAGEFPPETQENRYLERLRECYPIHPAIFDALYHVWSSMDKFQRTRGVLRLMAKAIHKLWTEGNRSPMIQPADLPMNDVEVRNDLLYYLPAGWDPVVEQDVDGPRSETARLDRDTRFGTVQAARRVARSLFLGTAPEGSSQASRGMDVSEVLLGCVQPGQTLGVYKDVLRRMSDTLHYLNTAGMRYFYDTRPNLRREMEGRKERFKEETENEIHQLVVNWLKRRLPFDGIHVFTSDADIPDDENLRLVVLSPEASYRQYYPEDVYSLAQKVLTHRGNTPRLNQNRLVFFAADADVLSRLRDNVRTLLAWASIQKDLAGKRMNLDMFQQQQVEEQLDKMQQVVQRLLQDTYKWLFVPYQEVRAGKGLGPLGWEKVMLPGSASDALSEILAKLKENEYLIDRWSPIHLKPRLEMWFWKEDKPAVSALDVWKNLCRYVYLERLSDRNVLQQAIEVGVLSGAFGIAYGATDGEYQGFAFGKAVSVTLDESLLLINPQVSQDYAERKRRESEEANRVKDEQPAPSSTVSSFSDKSVDGEVSWPAQVGLHSIPYGSEVRPSITRESLDSETRKHRFYGTVKLNAMTAKITFADIYEKLLKPLIERSDAKIDITMEITVQLAEGFDETLQRKIQENTKELGFNNDEFEKN